MNLAVHGNWSWFLDLQIFSASNRLDLQREYLIFWVGKFLVFDYLVPQNRLNLYIKMDNGQNFDHCRMDGSVLMHHDEKDAVGSPGDILVRRLKNRERQRRYRARKRQEADLRKASSVDQSTHYQQLPTQIVSVPVEVDISVNITSPDCLTRVHCQRDWKKDARMAHIHKKQETGPVGPTNTAITTPLPTFEECGVPADLESNSSNIPILDNSLTPESQSSRRHWKVEARNKRSLE